MSADMLRRLRSRRVTDRLEAIQALAESLSTQHQEALINTLNDPSNLVIQKAVAALRQGDWPTPPPIPAFIQTYQRLAKDGKKRDPGCVARMELLQAFIELRALEAGDILFDAVKTVQIEPSGAGLADMAVPLRAQAALGLGVFRLPRALVALTLLLFDMEPKVDVAPEEMLYATASARKAAAQAIGLLGDLGGVAVLALRLSQPKNELAEILIECMDALVLLDETVALDIVSGYIDARDEYLVVGAATALAKVAPAHHPELVERLRSRLEDLSANGRKGIAFAFAAMRSPSGDEGLSWMVRHPDEEMRLTAIDAVSVRGGQTARALLEEAALRDSDPYVRAAAARTLEAWSDDV